jgi:hypothetical protein
MTLRDFGFLLVEKWNNYYSEVTTKNILDWSISNLIFAIIFIVFSFFLLSVTLLILETILKKVKETWDGKIDPYIDNLNKKFGPLHALLVLLLLIIVLTFIILISLGFLSAIFDVLT